MSDITTIWDSANSRGDWKMNGPGLLSGNDLETAVEISLFTDHVAQSGDIIPDGTRNPRGWWGDVQPDGTVQPIGSRLWLLERSKSPLQSVLNNAVTYARQALQWLITDGVAAAVNVTGNWNANNFLALQVTVLRKNGTIVPLNYEWAWSQIQGM